MTISKLVFKDIILRDLIWEDIEDYVKWVNVETEWMNWDAPWEDSDDEEFVNRKRSMLEKPFPTPRTTFEVCYKDNTHLGWVTSYWMDDEKTKIAVGIDLPEKLYWGRGLGEQALKGWLDYLFRSRNEQTLYCETWSGNSRMIRLAEKCGFKEIEREIGCLVVAGNVYDGLTFSIDRNQFFKNQ